MSSFSLKSKSHWTTSGLRILDFLLVIFLGALIFSYRFDENFWETMPENYLYLILASSFLMTIIFSLMGVYEHLRGRSLWHLLKRLFYPWILCVLLLGLFALLTKTGAIYSRVWLVSWVSFSFIGLYFYRMVLVLCFRVLRAQGFNVRHIVIIGNGELLEKTIHTIQNHASMGYVIRSVIDPIKNQASLPEDLAGYLNNLKADEIWIALPLKNEELIREIIHQLRFSTITIHLIPDLLGLTLLRQDAFEMSGLPVLRLRTSPMKGSNELLKFLEDKILGFLIFVLLIPIMLLIMLSIKLTSPGPVFFKQKRYGLDNQEISVYKFRTMSIHQEDKKIIQATKDDSRITKLGRFLRRTSLDELPQFYNVLQGRMSIVGPRPHAVAHNEMYKELIDAYMLRHMVKPGITGWAQVNGFRGETDTLEKMKNRVEYDLFYIENWSLSFDLKIIFLTLYKGFINKNAY